MRTARKNRHWYNTHDKDVGGLILDGHGELVHDGRLYSDALTDPRMVDARPGSRRWGCR